VLLYRTWHLQHGKTLDRDEGIGQKYHINPSIFLPGS
jgi:hypothetical protein